MILGNHSYELSSNRSYSRTNEHAGGWTTVYKMHFSFAYMLICKKTQKGQIFREQAGGMGGLDGEECEQECCSVWEASPE